MERVAARTSWAWAHALFTAFADDKHLAWRIESLNDLALVCHCVRETFSLPSPRWYVHQFGQVMTGGLLERQCCCQVDAQA